MQNIGTVGFYLLYYLVKFLFLGILAIVVTLAKIEKGKKISKRLAKPMFFRDIFGVSIETYLQFLIIGYLTYTAGRFTSIGESLGSLIGYFIIIISIFFLPIALVYITIFPTKKKNSTQKK